MNITFGLIQAIPAVYLDDPYQVILSRLGGQTAASVSWTGSEWLFRLDPGRREHWLQDLLHETGHVYLGHVQKGEPSEPRPPELDQLVQSVLAGGMTTEEAARRAGDDLAAATLRILIEHEREAEEWAAKELERWRTILKEVQRCSSLA